jgi:hypothetical protein
MQPTAPSHRSSALPLTFVFLAFLFIMAVLSVQKASAYIPECGTAELRRTFYSDSSLTTVVGGWRYTCDCRVESWGSQTSYGTQQTLPCP